MLKVFVVQMVLLFTLAGAAQAAPALKLSQSEGGAETVTLLVSFVKDQRTDVVALGGDLGFDGAALEAPSIAAGPAAAAAGKGASVRIAAPGLARFVLVGFNTAAIESGVVAVISLRRKPGRGTVPLEISLMASAANRAGDAVPLADAAKTYTFR